MKQKFKCAFIGLSLALQDKSVLIQCFFAIFIVLFGIIIQFSYFEWLSVLICIALVIGFEMINTVIEKLCNLYSVKQNRQIKEIKDMAAGSVLLVSIVSLLVACCILIKHIIS